MIEGSNRPQPKPSEQARSDADEQVRPLTRRLSFQEAIGAVAASLPTEDDDAVVCPEVRRGETLSFYGVCPEVRRGKTISFYGATASHEVAQVAPIHIGGELVDVAAAFLPYAGKAHAIVGTTNHPTEWPAFLDEAHRLGWEFRGMVEREEMGTEEPERWTYLLFARRR